MDANEKLITTFATRVRQMLLQHQELKKENAELYAMVDERDKRLREVEEKLLGLLETSRKRVNKLIRDVNKCITLLSGK